MSENYYRSVLMNIKNNVLELLQQGNSKQAKDEMLKAINLRIEYENLKIA